MRRNLQAAQAAALWKEATMPAHLKAEKDALWKEATDINVFGKPASDEYKIRAAALNCELRKLGMQAACITEG